MEESKKEQLWENCKEKVDNFCFVSRVKTTMLLCLILNTHLDMFGVWISSFRDLASSDTIAYWVQLANIHPISLWLNFLHY